VAGAPKIASELLSEITLYTGTMWHDWIHNTLRRLGVPYMAEVNLNPWLPKGWGGTADGIFWHPDLKAFVLGDFKTQKGEGMRYIASGGAKEEHRYQASLYWHAIKQMGLPLAKVIGIYYLPKNDTRGKDDVVEPILVDFEPIPAPQLAKVAAKRYGRVSEYMESLEDRGGGGTHTLSDWVTPKLEPAQPRQQRVFFDRKTDTRELKLVPHWSAAYCPFPNELCDCSEQGTTKLGIYDELGHYFPRPGYESIEPEVTP
jgi:hypothetical protein